MNSSKGKFGKISYENFINKLGENKKVKPVQLEQIGDVNNPRYDYIINLEQENEPDYQFQVQRTVWILSRDYNIDIIFSFRENGYFISVEKKWINFNRKKANRLLAFNYFYKF